ncbi:2-amino-4-hydroxy-6-hydroxymethyldihydropteridine diphosphokinase [Paenibacillus macquariensis]|uniref:2-amino-4-hydroxy-6-hydroxymethyldihydropteridine diphosphokinase n=1 Tax=Paenibacillus macquariensis TaxID=948756 RepID=A0ABY1KFD2_9BACL|nr:2-amino-4-hydroxy-6-hydroxymethyldihydropteridine diphosphokinase [Paenibacillus macquariensis]MEC0094104.1 2-amino-4-hydroxy-6-hydroxymethyldihydropteridine diphosphokinase [Paenibacillus macquariensis]OAB26129.1 2-amino-4-hydroxy-6-hydroxymethyldihydropteridine pyrophosphokinase [Paenibacillus macquariensis subsp. macquariensis]SIR60120.1 2-amino-4-hydroxy-6-hydroxymethyldihydropteridinediphosphokinase [Paenibacillus macquariensis]
MKSHSTSELSEAYIALGANLGDREGTLMEAVNRLHTHQQITVLRGSNLYETEPVGYLDQPHFLNMVVAVNTDLNPHALLKVMQEIERELGRVRHTHWGPRTVDLDLLWMEGLVEDTPDLILPHPRMEERAFVLVPLHDILPSEETSGLHSVVKAALERLDGKEGIQLWRTYNWQPESVLSEN